MKPVHANIPHQLGKADAKQRLENGMGKLSETNG